MREDSQRGGGRACGAWNALPPSSPRALHTSSPRGAHTLRHGGYAEPQHRPTKGMLTGANLGWQQVAQAVPATSGGSSPRPPSSMSAASRTQPLPSRPETQTPPPPQPQPPSPPARERGNSFFFTALTDGYSAQHRLRYSDCSHVLLEERAAAHTAASTRQPVRVDGARLPDGLHPNARGYAALWACMLPHLATLAGEV